MGELPGIVLNGHGLAPASSIGICSRITESVQTIPDNARDFASMGEDHGMVCARNDVVRFAGFQRENPVRIPVDMENIRRNFFIFPANDLPYRPTHVLVAQARHEPVKEFDVLLVVQSKITSPKHEVNLVHEYNQTGVLDLCK